MTQVHSLDSGIINFSGRLRFLTQHVGLIALQKMQSESEQQERSSELEETFQQIESTCMQLLGEIGTIQSGGAPEMLDEDVKESLRKWMNDGLVPLRRLVSAGLDISDRSSVIAAVNSASDTVDSVVDSAEEASHGRVRVLLALSISRACVGVVWALVVTVCAFSDVWRSYIRTYNLLQAAEQQRTSLMRAAFDAVIKVQPAGPFHITEDSRELCHILGQPVQGKSLIDFAGQTEEQEKLREFFEREIRRPARRTSPFSLDLWWWNLAPGGPASDLPVAPMICTRLLCGERSDRELGMEILVVGSTSCDFNADKYAALLAVRVVPCSPSSTPRRYPVAELPMHEEASDHGRGIGQDMADVNFFQLAIGPNRSVYTARSNTHPSSGTGETVRAMGPPGVDGQLTPRSEQNDTPPPSILGMPAEGIPPAERGGERWMEQVAQEGLATQLTAALRGLERNGAIGAAASDPA